MNAKLKITVDGIHLDHKLENENSAQEVIEQIQMWLTSQQRIPSIISLNGKQYDKKTMGTIHIDKIDSIEFSTIHPHELSIRRIHLLEDIIYILQDAQRKNDKEAIKNFQKNSEEICELFQSTLPGEKTPNFFSADKTIFMHVLELLKVRKEEFLDPVGVGVQTGTMLLQHLGKLSELPVMMQTGKAQVAMKLLIIFTESARKLLRIYLIAKKRFPSLDIKNLEHINAPLTELEKALCNEDTVLIGDLIEYEIIPQFKDSIRQIVEEFSTVGALTHN